jgi:hypothetical protein
MWRKSAKSSIYKSIYSKRKEFQNMNVNEVPVYLFTGFLEAGKTSFIQETLEDPDFNNGERTLILMCEEGEKVLDPQKFAFSNFQLVILEDEEQLTAEYLANLDKSDCFERVVIEYNGMWLLDRLYDAIPAHWLVYQEMALIDARTFFIYNNNMRNLMVDKMKSPEAIVFKNFNNAMDKLDYHKIVRAINRRCEIIYEYSPDHVEFDDIEDSLPYDLDQDVIEISDQDYAIWYRDVNEEEEKYFGKTFTVKGRTLLGGGLKEDEFVLGRHIMTCCIEDIQFGGLMAKYENAKDLEHGGWAIVTARIDKEFNHMYNSEGPVLKVIKIEKTVAPEEEVATFY